MNPGWLIMCVGFGLMLGGFIAFEHNAPDPMRAILFFVVGFLVVFMGHLINGYIAEEREAARQKRILNLEELFPKKRRYTYRGKIRLIVILGIPVGLGILVVALSSAYNQGPIFDGRF